MRPSTLSFPRAAAPLAWLLALAFPGAAFATPDAADAARPLRPQDVAVLAAACSNCHGPDGRSTGGVPSLRGQDGAHLLQRMQAFKAGQPAIDATVMTRLMKGYDDAEIRALAQWFAARGKGR